MRPVTKTRATACEFRPVIRKLAQAGVGSDEIPSAFTVKVAVIGFAPHTRAYN